MSASVESPRWQAVGMVIDLNAKDHRSGRYGVVHELVAWFKAIRLFRDTEDERLYLHEPTTDDLRQHRTWLASLIADGERLLAEAEAAGGLPHGSVPFTLGDVDAAIRNLRTDERMWHGSSSEAERKQILGRVFDVQKSLTGSDPSGQVRPGHVRG
jgi:hypothetical protein